MFLTCSWGCGIKGPAAGGCQGSQVDDTCCAAQGRKPAFAAMQPDGRGRPGSSQGGEICDQQQKGERQHSAFRCRSCFCAAPLAGVICIWDVVSCYEEL